MSTKNRPRTCASEARAGFAAFLVAVASGPAAPQQGFAIDVGMIPRHVETVFGIDRQTEADLLYLNNGDLISGTVLNEALEIDTAYGRLTTPAPSIAGLSFLGEGHSKLITINNSRFSGTMLDETITFDLAAGPVIEVSVDAVLGVVFGIGDGEAEIVASSDWSELILLADGDYFSGQVVDGEIVIATTYATIPLGMADIGAVTIAQREPFDAVVTLINAEQLNGQLESGELTVAAAAGGDIVLSMSQLTSLIRRDAVDAVIGGAAVAAPEPAAELVLPPADEPDIALFDPAVAAGETVALRCVACHSFEQGGGNLIGPNLFGIVGRPIGHVEDFNYSDAITALHADGATWTVEQLDVFLASPWDTIPGNRMSAPGITSNDDRANLLAYLTSLSDSVAALEEEPPAMEADRPADRALELETAVAAADAAAGQTVSFQCIGCHSLGEGEPARVGPNLFGIVSRPIGGVEGYRYSDAFAALNGGGATWTIDRLSAFLTNPSEEIPGTNMGFGGVRVEDDLLNLLAYLALLVEAPAGAAVQAGEAAPDDEPPPAEEAAAVKPQQQLPLNRTIEEANVAYERGDYETAFAIYLPHAERGNANAQAFIGNMYSNGEGVPRDYAEAVRWYRLAADQGDASAQISLGFLYELGYGMPRDHGEAIAWLRLGGVEYLITTIWPDNHPDDIDTYMQDPGGNIVWYHNAEAGLLSLDRDDRGNYRDTIVINGQRIVNPLNQENITMRGIVAGEYVINVHHYVANGVDPVPVTVKVERINPILEVVFSTTLELDHRGQEETVVRFTLDENGNPSNINAQPKSLTLLVRGGL